MGVCAKHKPKRDLVRHKLYGRKWQGFRETYLSEHPWCVRCMTKGVHRAATEVHHVVPHRGDADKFYAGPFEALCHDCHSSETAKESGLNTPHPKNFHRDT